MQITRTVEAIQAIREACQVAAEVLAYMVETVEAGMTTYDLDQMGRKKIAELGAESACFNYRHEKNIMRFEKVKKRFFSFAFQPRP